MSANPQDVAAGARWPATPRSRALLGVGLGAVAIAGLIGGLSLADITGSHEGQVAATGPPPSSTALVPAGSAPSSSAAPSTTAATTVAPSTSTSSSTTSSSSTSTTRPSTSSSATAVSSSSIPVTATPTNPAATAPPPATINVAYSQGSDGALEVPRNGTALIQLTNTGGQQGQWSFSLPTPEYSLSQTTGVVDPGQTVSVTVRETKNKAHSSAINAVVSPGTRLTIVLVTP